MIFVDTNVFMYAVRTPPCSPSERPGILCRSQPERHTVVYFSRGHAGAGPCVFANGKAANLRCNARSDSKYAGVEVWPLEEADVTLARQLHEQFPALQARDLCHLASCRRRGVRQIKTFDQTFADISGNPSVQ